MDGERVEGITGAEIKWNTIDGIIFKNERKEGEGGKRETVGG